MSHLNRMFVSKTRSSPCNSNNEDRSRNDNTSRVSVTVSASLKGFSGMGIQQQNPPARDKHYHQQYQEQQRRRWNADEVTNDDDDDQDQEQQETQTDWEHYCSSLTLDKVLKLGLLCVNYIIRNQEQVSAAKKLKKFRSHFGVGPAAVVAFIKDLPTQEGNNFLLHDFFMALSFAKSYNTREVHGDNWNMCADKVKKNVERYFKKLQSMKNKKIYIGGFKDDTEYVYTIDGVHMSTRENRINPTSKVYSHKFNGPGITYEVGIAIWESRLLWIKGPFVASTHDAKMCRSDGGVNDEKLQGKRGVGDSAYKKIPSMTVHREGHSKEMTNFINRVRARHESFYNKIKVFGILAHKFRGSWNKREEHKIFFEGLAVLVQYDMENGHPLMEA